MSKKDYNVVKKGRKKTERKKRKMKKEVNNWIMNDNARTLKGQLQYAVACEQEGYDDEYSGDHYVGEIVMYRTHQCKVTHVWKDEEGNNGISLIPTGNYGFEIDVTEKRFEEMNKKGARQ